MTAKNWQGGAFTSETFFPGSWHNRLWDSVKSIWSFIVACFTLSKEIEEEFKNGKTLRHSRGLTRERVLEKLDRI